MSERKPTWTQTEAIAFATLLESIAPEFGAHVALTGGTLYKVAPNSCKPQCRKDVDILFYRIRQVKEIDEPGLMLALTGRTGADGALKLGERYGWVQKATYYGKPVDLFFPESKHNNQFPMRPGDTRNARYFDAPSNEDLI